MRLLFARLCVALVVGLRMFIETMMTRHLRILSYVRPLQSPRRHKERRFTATAFCLNFYRHICGHLYDYHPEFAAGWWNIYFWNSARAHRRESKNKANLILCLLALISHVIYLLFDSIFTRCLMSMKKYIKFWWDFEDVERVLKISLILCRKFKFFINEN